MPETVNRVDLESKVKGIYKQVAEDPTGDFHFEMGRGLAERLGYGSEFLDQIDSEAIQSFAGVGYHFGLAELQPGERVLDLGSGSGTDAFWAAIQVGPTGEVVGVDMTQEQLDKSTAIGERIGVSNIKFELGNIEDLTRFPDETFDVVISNGVINLAPDKSSVFEEAARVLRRGGRLAISDIVTGRQLTEAIVCDANLWASCIGGAMQVDVYTQIIEDSGLDVSMKIDNPQYLFLSKQARGASRTYDVKSISLLAVKH